MLPIMICVFVSSVSIAAVGHFVGTWKFSMAFFGSLLIAGVTYPYLRARRDNELAILGSVFVRPDDSGVHRWGSDVTAMFVSTMASVLPLLHLVGGGA